MAIPVGSERTIMADLSTKYLGMTLKNPIVVGSSGLTSSVEKVAAVENAGAGAVILKSIFEEQIRFETEQRMEESELGMHPEAAEYLSALSHDYSIRSYLDLVEQCRNKVKIPVVASINCVTGSEWIDFAKRIEGAGAQALELNVLPTDFTDKDPRVLEDEYFRIVEKVLKVVSIPVSLKVGAVFTNIPRTLVALSSTGIAGLTLFNRYWAPDIDIETAQLESASPFSCHDEIRTTLRWIGYIAESVDCDIAGSGGVYDAAGALKLLMSGATVVQVASALYQNGVSHVGSLVEGIQTYLAKRNVAGIDTIRGALSAKTEQERRKFGRVQFVKYYAGLE